MNTEQQHQQCKEFDWKEYEKVEFDWELFSEVNLQKWLDQFEEWIFPWCCYHPEKEQLDKGADRYLEGLLKRVKTPYDRAKLYFSSKSPDARRNLITNSIREYMDTSFFYENFGITPMMLEYCDANWVEDMIMISNAESMSETDGGLRIRKSDGTIIGG